MTLCWAPGVSMEVMEAFHAAEEMAAEESPQISAATQFSDGDRWGRTATFNSIFETASQGQPTTLRWGFMQDGTSIAGFNGEPTSDSDLITFLDGRYGVTSGGAPTAFIESGDDWKYLDDGSNQGTAWRATGFNDTTWAAGPSQLGYGDGDEATVVSFGGNPNDKHITTYFRKTFTINNPDAFASIALNFTYDDSIVIYLNGTEVARENITANPAFDDFANGTGPENGTASRTLPPSAFISGSNTFAVEIHQASRTSSDISFDLNLTGIPDGGSDLTTRPWFPAFQSAFDNISSLTGVTYVYEPNDDGADLTNFSRPAGSIGVRADIRIGGHFIDGDSGSNTLAYNFSPGAGGDMVIDTGNTSFYGNTSSNSLNLRNVVEHEHGHGLGLSHVCPITQTKLMEPFISRRFRGLQLDDIFSLNRLYGDFFEKQNASRNNDSANQASLLPVMIGEAYRREYLSIDDNSDDDFYRLANVPAGTSITCKVIPVSTPAGFREGPQNSDGSCSAGSSFDFTNIHDLGLALLSSNGNTILANANLQPGGQAEEIITFEAPATGDYFIRVTGDSSNNTQLYTLEVDLAGPPETPTNLLADTTGTGQVTLTWIDNSDNETGFQIERKLEADSIWSPYASVAAGSESYEDGEPALGSNLFYRVIALGTSSNSDPSNEETLMIADLSVQNYLFDFGEVDSPLAPGAIRISPLTRGDVSWSAPVSSRDRGGLDPSNRDYLFAAEPRTWSHRITNGVWQVTVRQGDETTPREELTISAEGILQVQDTSSAASEFVENTFIVEVSDGSLDLTFDDLGGDSDRWVVNRLELLRISPYQLWTIREELPEALDAPGQDADGDGIANIQEYYFGLPPLTPGPPIEISSAISLDGSNYIFTFTRDPASPVDSAVLEVSNDLENWVTLTPPSGSIETSPNGDLEDVILTLPAVGERFFIRLALGLSE